MTGNFLEEYLLSFSTGNDGYLSQEQFNRMCSEPSIGFDAKTSAELFRKLPKNSMGTVKVSDIIQELSNWQDENYAAATTTTKDMDQKKTSTTSRPHPLKMTTNDKDEEVVVYEYENNPIVSPFLESNTNFKDFESVLTQKYPELLNSFQNLAMDIKSEIKAKKVEKDELEHSFAEERKQRREDLTRLEMELEAEYRSAESQIEEKIRKELEKKYQNVISKKELEVNQYKDLINDIETKRENYAANRPSRVSGIYDYDFDGQDPLRTPMNAKPSVHEFEKLSIQEINETVERMDPNDVNLKELLHYTLGKLESSESELKMINDQLDIQANQLMEREVNAEENQKIRDRLECEISSIKKKLKELNDTSLSSPDNDHEPFSDATSIVQTSGVHQRVNKNNLYPDRHQPKKSVETYNPFTDDGSENSELHVSILDSSEENQQPERLFKVIMVGDSSVGKSSFLNRFCTKTFYNAYKSTIGVDFMSKNIRIDNKLYAIQLWDTAGQEKYRSIVKSFFRKSDGAIVMYDVTNQKSFWSVREWISLIEDTGDKIPIVVVANKIDLRDNLENISRKNNHVINHEHGIKLAKSYDADFIEVSVAKNINVQEAVITLSRNMKLHDDQRLSEAADCVVNVASEKTNIPCCK